MATVKLTDAIVRTLPTPPKANKVYYDAVGPAGFGARVTANGSRSFIYNYRTRATGRERRITIGKFPNWSTCSARAEAKRLRQLIDQGEDPLGNIEAERDAPTVAELLVRFDAEHVAARLRPGSQRHYRSIIRKHIAAHFGTHTKVRDVRFDDIDALHRRITRAGNAIAANRVLAVCSKLFALSVRWNMRDTNPVRGVEHNAEVKRRRYLAGDELQRLLKALAAYPDQQVPNIIRLLLLTGARVGEVRAMRWSDLDLSQGTWSKPASTTKQKRDHSAPLSAPARQLLSELHTRGRAGDWVFPSDNSRVGHVASFEHKWISICEMAGIHGLHIHDLRHTHATMLASGGASLPLIGALLGHSNPTTTHRYAHLYDDPMRSAVEKVGAIVVSASEGATKEPVPFLPLKGGRRRGR